MPRKWHDLYSIGPEQKKGKAMDFIDVALLGVLVFCALSLAVQADNARRDQQKTRDAGREAGSLWHHMVKLHRERASRKNAKNPARPKPLTSAQRKAMKLQERPARPADLASKTPREAQPASQPSRAIRQGWAICDIAFEYEDASGNWTDRAVTVHSVTPAHIKGECHSARAERTFRTDRVMSDITDIDTGEILDIDDWLERYG